jgi:hypothetical protein
MKSSSAIGFGGPIAVGPGPRGFGIRSLAGNAAFARTRAFDAQETKLGRVALHAVPLEGQCRVEATLSAKFVSGMLAASTVIRTKGKPIAASSRPLVIANFFLFQHDPVALCGLCCMGQFRNRAGESEADCTGKRSSQEQMIWSHARPASVM